VLLNDIFTVLTHTLKWFSTFRKNVPPPKLRQPFTTQHDVTSNKKSVSINNALRTSNLTSCALVWNYP